VRLSNTEERREKIVNDGERLTTPPDSEALATTPTPSLSPAPPSPASPYPLPGQVLGMINAVGEVMVTTNQRMNASDRHVERLLELQLAAQPKMLAAYQTQIEGLLKYIEVLQNQNQKLLADLQTWHESQRTDRIKEKELEIKKTAIEEGSSFVKMMAPTLIGFMAAKLDPSDPTKADNAIAAILTGITEDQARKLADGGLVTPQQGFQALGFRQNPPQRGQLTAWMQSFSAEAITKIGASGILDKNQTLAFVAAHELA